jgi:CRISPR-associated helicase Cas3/CRISPR-associated endonuclease Cas3-HD
MLLAHREENDEGNALEQYLEEHLKEVGRRAGNIGREIGLEAFMKVAGYLHDCGKADRNFQTYISSKKKQQVNHSSAGGRILEDCINSLPVLEEVKVSRSFRYFQEILTYIIFAHHGLYDQVTYGSTENNTYRRFCYDKDEDYHYKEDVMPFVKQFDIDLQKQSEKPLTILIFEAFEEFKNVYSNILNLSSKNSDKESKKEEKEYYITCLVRLCLSILKEADIYDSANAFHNPKQHLWMKDERAKVWEDVYKRIEHMYQAYENESVLSEINRARNSLADLVKNAAITNDYGIFKLELPTGAGKTKSGLRYALANAREFNRNRIFYITAYLSVLEQNASDIRSIVDMDEVILEHHSNMTVEVKEELESSEDITEYQFQTYLRDSWENLIILTTMVQFFNTLFKEKSANIRRFCKLINSVIIIDEVQSIPIKVLSNFNLMMNFMKEIMHCNIVHCTATQPVLDNIAMRYKLNYGDKKGEKAAIVNTKRKEIECFQRVDFYNLTGKDARIALSTKELFTYIETELRIFDSCLVVLNTKAAVAELYNYLENNLLETEIIYLSTNLCAAHRLDIISELKVKLQQNRGDFVHNKIVCISSQLIEAGVDLDFDVVFRSLAGIDSLVQCAGRCNREGKLMLNGRYVHGKLYIIRYLQENIGNLPEIKATVVASEYAIRRCENDQIKESNLVKIEELQAPYFNKYYVENKSKLDYMDIKRNSSMLEELGRNQPDRDAFSLGDHEGQKPVLYQAFRTAAENFELIGQNTVGVIVIYNNQTLLEMLETAMKRQDHSGVQRLLQQLQRYTVNIYFTPKLEPFISKNDKLNVYILQKEYYNGKIGVKLDQLADLII